MRAVGGTALGNRSRARSMTGGVTALAALLIGAGALSACGDDSTASAPASAPQTTTASATSPASESASESSARDSASASATDSGDAGAAAEGSPTQLPATEPAAGNAGSIAALPNNAKAYLNALRDQKVTLLGDTDDSIALGAAETVCAQTKANVSPAQIKVNVLPIVGSGKTDAAQANDQTDKLIAAAQRYYCPTR